MRVLRSGEFPSSDAAFLSLLYIPLEYLPAFPSPLRNSHINLIARTGFVTGGHYGLSTGRETSATLFPSCRSSCVRVRLDFHCAH